MAIRTSTMNQNFRISDAIPAAQAAALGRRDRQGGIVQALNGAAFVADKMGVFVAGFSLWVAQAIEPDLFIAAGAMEEVFFGERVESAV